MTALEVGFFSIPVSDLASAKNFYQKVKGLNFKDRDAAFADAFAGKSMIGSLELASRDAQPSINGPLIYFRASFMKETLASVTANGGTVLSHLAMNGGENGYTAKIPDPFGNGIGFWAPEY